MGNRFLYIIKTFKKQMFRILFLYKNINKYYLESSISDKTGRFKSILSKWGCKIREFVLVFFLVKTVVFEINTGVSSNTEFASINAGGAYT